MSVNDVGLAPWEEPTDPDRPSPWELDESPFMDEDEPGYIETYACPICGQAKCGGYCA